MKAVTHIQVKSVGDVDDYLNEHGLSLAEVNITYTYNPRGSKYTIFYPIEISDKESK